MKRLLNRINGIPKPGARVCHLAVLIGSVGLVGFLTGDTALARKWVPAEGLPPNTVAKQRIPEKQSAETGDTELAEQEAPGKASTRNFSPEFRRPVNYIPYDTPLSRNWVPESVASESPSRMSASLSLLERRSFEHIMGFTESGDFLHDTDGEYGGHEEHGEYGKIVQVEYAAPMDDVGPPLPAKSPPGALGGVPYASETPETYPGHTPGAYASGHATYVAPGTHAVHGTAEVRSPFPGSVSPFDNTFSGVPPSQTDLSYPASTEASQALIVPAYSGDHREWAERFALENARIPRPGGVSPESPEQRPPAPTRESASTTILDLTPSYTKHLPYTQVRGAVVCQSNFPFSEMGRLLDEIDSLQTDLADYIGIPEPREKIELCLFRDEKSYIAFLKDVFPDAPRDRRALYVKMPGQPGALLVQRTSEFAIDLRHEMTHAIIHAGIETVPIWLDEGLAKYFEPAPKDRPHLNPYLKPISRNNIFGIIPNLDRLEKLEHVGEMGPKEYRDSWAWVHFLIHYSPETHQLLAGYLQMLGTLPPEQKKVPTLSGYLKERVGNPRGAYGTHFKKWVR